MAKSDEARLGIDGVIEWHDDGGKLHRADGPAATYPDGRRVWFVEGEKVREERSVSVF
jgi:hypothetical protein